MNENDQELNELELEDILKEFLGEEDDSMSAAEAAASHALHRPTSLSGAMAKTAI